MRNTKFQFTDDDDDDDDGGGGGKVKLSLCFNWGPRH